MGQPHKYIGFFYFTSKSACALQRRKDLSPTTMCYFLAITVGLAIAATFFLAALLAGCGVENELLACGHAAARRKCGTQPNGLRNCGVVPRGAAVKV